MPQTPEFGRRVLVIDDDASVCTLVERVLAACGWSVTVTRTAEEADDLLLVADWDAVLVDKNLPRTSGLEFAERVRARRPDAGIVLMTAQPDPSVRRGLYDTYLPKPFRSLDDLHTSLVAAQQRRRRAREIDALKQKLVTVQASLEPPDTRNPSRP